MLLCRAGVAEILYHYRDFRPIGSISVASKDADCTWRTQMSLGRLKARAVLNDFRKNVKQPSGYSLAGDADGTAFIEA